MLAPSGRDVGLLKNVAGGPVIARVATGGVLLPPPPSPPASNTTNSTTASAIAAATPDAIKRRRKRPASWGACFSTAAAVSFPVGDGATGSDDAACDGARRAPQSPQNCWPSGFSWPFARRHRAPAPPVIENLDCDRLAPPGDDVRARAPAPPRTLGPGGSGSLERELS
jgi:hypothetical protein